MTAFRFTLLSCMGLILISLTSCQTKPTGGADGSPDGSRLSVAAVNYPLAYFARRIGGEQVEVLLPIPPEEDPAYWMPDAEAIASYQQADLILLNGAGYARWVERVSLPPSKLHDTSAGFADEYLPLDDTVTHSHGLGGEHTHAGWAFTTWLDPRLARKQAEALCDGLIRLRPDSEAMFRDNLRPLIDELDALDVAMAETFDPDQPLLFSHPVYQYLTHRYNLNARSLHWEPDETPTEAMWAELAKLRREHPATWIAWEAQPLRKTEERLAKEGVRSILFAPCAKAPSEGDYLTVMRANVAALARLGGGS